MTHDLDFGEILAVSNSQKPSVIQIRSVDVSPDTIGKSVLKAINQFKKDIESGALVTIDLTKTRLRSLPFYDDEPQ